MSATGPMATHTVKEGDSLWSISKAYGVSWRELMKLNPELKDRIPSYWVNPGEIVKLPTCMETGDVKKVGQPCPHKMKVMTIIPIDPARPIRLCEPTGFKVLTYQGTPNDFDKQTRVVWFVRFANTTDNLVTKHPDLFKVRGEKLEITCVPFEWHDKVIEIGADFDVPPAKPMWTVKPMSCELYDWIATIQRAEAAYHGMSPVEITNAMRLIAGYDNDLFRCMYGGRWIVKRKRLKRQFDDVREVEYEETGGVLFAKERGARYVGPPPPGAVLLPPQLPPGDYQKLHGWTSHAIKGGVEVGIARDPDGNAVAVGHVLTGISAGVYHDERADLAPEVPIAGEKMDNLYATTISGDLGQVAVMKLSGAQKAPTYIGPNTDATEAELIGDIDGWLLGKAEPKGGGTRKLSEILLDYYCPCRHKPLNFKNRYTLFSVQALGRLDDQVKRFADSYIYGEYKRQKKSEWDAAFTSVSKHVDNALKEFKAWLATK